VDRFLSGEANDYTLWAKTVLRSDAEMESIDNADGGLELPSPVQACCSFTGSIESLSPANEVDAGHLYCALEDLIRLLLILTTAGAVSSVINAVHLD
jgi:hypothetical protein